MIHTRRGPLAACILGLFLAGAAGFGLRGRGAPVSQTADPSGPVDLSAPADRVPYDPELINRTVAFWEGLARRDPEGAIAERELAGAYLARQRETGDVADAVRAEAAARRSLKIVPRNASAMSRLARSLLAQHRFPEALEVARRAGAFDPRSARLLADVQIELGDYDAAEKALASSSSGSDDLDYYASRARLEGINGRPEVALRLLREAIRVTDKRPDMPAATVAWYHTMVGHAHVEAGRLDEADRACGVALKIFPRDYHAMTVMASAAAWRGNWRDAISWGEKAVKICPQNPEAMKLIGDAHAAMGRDDEAEVWYARLKALAHSFPRIYDRHWALFCADKGRDLDEALALARDDLTLRQDIHAHDTLAWVYFKKGMQAEAQSAMRMALARDTKEATLLYHAGMIARSGGDLTAARDYFTRARSLNPHAVPLRWLRWMDATRNG